MNPNTTPNPSAGPAPVESTARKETPAKPRFTLRNIAEVILGVVILILAVTSFTNHLGKVRAQESLSAMQQVHAAFVATKDLKLDQASTESFNQGYESAIWDTFFKRASLVVEEKPNGDVILWKKTPPIPKIQQEVNAKKEQKVTLPPENAEDAKANSADNAGPQILIQTGEITEVIEDSPAKHKRN
jgi:hypothetical protein